METFCDRVKTKFELKDATICRLLLCPTGEIIDDISLIEKNDKIEVELGPPAIRYHPFGFETKQEDSQLFTGEILRQTFPPPPPPPLIGFQIPKFVPNSRIETDFNYPDYRQFPL